MRTLICPTSILDAARAFAARVPDGAGMFSRACGTTDPESGETTITHYLSHYVVHDHYLAALLPYKSWYQDDDGELQYTQYDGDVLGMLDALSIEGDDVADALAVLGTLDISDQSAEAACSRLGVVML